MERIYNKLVRDNLPDIMRQENELPFTRVLSDDEYRVELFKKLQEECGEAVNSRSSKDLMTELGDVLEVVRAIAKLENQDLDAVIAAADEKKLKKGGFEKRVYLEKTLNDEY